MSNNTTTDSTTEENDDSFPLSVVIPSGIVLTLMIILAITGNILTIAAFIKDKQLRVVYNIYIVNLAITDLLIGCISMPFYVVYTLLKYSWPFGYHFCKIYMVTDFTICLESVLVMIILSLDRVLLVKWGPHYFQKETKRRAYIKIAVSWVIAFSLYSPAIIGWDLWTGEDTNEEGDCDVQFAYNVTFTTVTAVCEFIIPFVTLATLNAMILLEIRKRRKTMIKPSIQSKKVVQSVITTSSEPRNNVTGAQSDKPHVSTVTSGKQTVNGLKKDTDISTRRDIKAAKYLAILVLVFAFTWAPYTVTTIIISFCDSCVNKDAYEFLNWLLWSKAAINPFLYALNSEIFRKNFRKMIFCLPVCKRKIVPDVAVRNVTVTSRT